MTTTEEWCSIPKYVPSMYMLNLKFSWWRVITRTQGTVTAIVLSLVWDPIIADILTVRYVHSIMIFEGGQLSIRSATNTNVINSEYLELRRHRKRVSLYPQGKRNLTGWVPSFSLHSCCARHRPGDFGLLVFAWYRGAVWCCLILRVHSELTK